MAKVNQKMSTQDLSKSTFANSADEIRKKFRVPVHTELPGEMMNPRVPENFAESFKLFTEYYALLQFENQKDLFLNKYTSWNDAAIKAEIQVIEQWMGDAEKINYGEACLDLRNQAIKNIDSQPHEYLRLKNDFYQSYPMTRIQHWESSTAAVVYGRYFLFYKYLRQLTASLPAVKGKKSETLDAPAIAAFCKILAEKLLPAQGNDGNEVYCQKICIKYNLPYTDNVRKAFSDQVSKARWEKIKKLILPDITEADIKKEIEVYIKPNHTRP